MSLLSVFLGDRGVGRLGFCEGVTLMNNPMLSLPVQSVDFLSFLFLFPHAHTQTHRLLFSIHIF